MQKFNDCNKDKPSVNKREGKFITHGLINTGPGIYFVLMNGKDNGYKIEILYYAIKWKLDFSIDTSNRSLAMAIFEINKYKSVLYT